MTAARVVGATGRVAVVAGVILLLFVVYQLWGTGLQHRLAQDDLENDFQANLDTASEIDSVPAAAAVAAADDTSPDAAGALLVQSITTPASAVTDAEQVTYSQEVLDLLPVLYPGAGEASARIRIPAIGVDEIVVFGVGAEDLRKGPGLYDFAPLPGQPGNAAMAGHRTTYGAPFARLDDLQPGDEIVVQTLQGTFTYTVFGHQVLNGDVLGHFIVPPSSVEVLADQGDNRLTLTACHPEYSARERIVVTAGLVGEPAIALPRPGELVPVEAEAVTAGEADGGSDASDDFAGASAAGTQLASTSVVESAGFGPGLGGDRGAVGLFALWAFASAAIWFTAWFVGRRWRRWPVYALAALPFLAILFGTFAYLDAALPAY